jgi:hypothetical protein
MNRLTVLQKLIDHFNAKTYLEIGVKRGRVISSIKAPNKIGVDPKFVFPRKLKLKKAVGLINFKTFEITSDAFFEKEARRVLKNGIDVAFVDGLHTYEQSLRDVENCLQYLNPSGVIVMHDCNPTDSATAYPLKESQSFEDLAKMADAGQLPGWKKSWCGDVWKTIVHLRINNKDLNVFTLDADFGLGVIARGKSDFLVNSTLDELKKAEYSFLEKNRTQLLNLKPSTYFNEFLNAGAVLPIER